MKKYTNRDKERNGERDGDHCLSPYLRHHGHGSCYHVYDEHNNKQLHLCWILLVAALGFSNITIFKVVILSSIVLIAIAAFEELKGMVKVVLLAGIEVILGVVYKHPNEEHDDVVMVKAAMFGEVFEWVGYKVTIKTFIWRIQDSCVWSVKDVSRDLLLKVNLSRMYNLITSQSNSAYYFRSNKIIRVKFARRAFADCGNSAINFIAGLWFWIRFRVICGSVDGHIFRPD